MNPSPFEEQTGPGPEEVYTVSQLTGEVRALLEECYPPIWVEGEISNLARPASGHIYFTLKDASSQVRCAMFRNQNRNLWFTPENGCQVLLQAEVSLYSARGDFQLIVRHMEAYGEGELRREFERLKRKLDGEGLFDPEHKQPLPELPERIGVITSPSGAAVHDILTVLNRRFPTVPVRIYPTAVQGEAAADGIVRAIKLAGRRKECDLLIVARGGGSLEDLQPFNEEPVARAIHACSLPVITGVGHEVDITIADFVADLRAATPSAAAEAAVPDQQEWCRLLAGMADRLTNAMQGRVQEDGQRLDWLIRRLQHPQQALQERGQRLQGLCVRLAAAQQARLHEARMRLAAHHTGLQKGHPGAALAVCRTRLSQLGKRLISGQHSHHSRQRERLGALVRALNGVSPLATLERGYAIVTTEEGRLIGSVDDSEVGDPLNARFTDGTLRCRVEAKEKGGG